jgi:hypothetical protein
LKTDGGRTFVQPPSFYGLEPEDFAELADVFGVFIMQ